MNGDKLVDNTDIQLLIQNRVSEIPCDKLYPVASNVFNRVDLELTEDFPTSGFSQRLVLRGEQDAFRLFTDTNNPPVAVSSPQGTVYILPPPFKKERTVWIEYLKPTVGRVSHVYWNNTANMAIGTVSNEVVACEIYLLADTDNDGTIDPDMGGERE